MRAIIRALSSGEHYYAEIGDDGTIEELSDRLDVVGARDPDTGQPTDWEPWNGSHTEGWDDPAQAWDEAVYVVVHRYDGA